MNIEYAIHGSYKEGYKKGREDALRWIPCKEKLPEEMVDVLAYDGVDMFIAYLWHGKWNSTDANFDSYTNILVWMPLPEPWKDGE